MDHLKQVGLIFDLCEALVKSMSHSLVEDRNVCDLVYDLGEEVQSKALKTNTIEAVIKAIKKA